MTEDKNGTETFVVGHGQYLQDYPGQARILSLTRMVSSGQFGNPSLVKGVIKNMHAQMASDAFERGLGIIGLADPLYRVEQHLALRETPPEPSGYQNPEWTKEEPPAHLLDDMASVEILVEAVGFPIRIREP